MVTNEGHGLLLAFVATAIAALVAVFLSPM
jgi:hypothetical protein